MNATNEIIETLKKVDNESTDSPYWLIIDPGPIRSRVEDYTDDDGKVHQFDPNEHMEGLLDAITSCITGPYFSREDAENHLSGRHYEFSKDAYVYCHSGYWSPKWKALCREIGVGRH